MITRGRTLKDLGVKVGDWVEFYKLTSVPKQIAFITEGGDYYYRNTQVWPSGTPAVGELCVLTDQPNFVVSKPPV